MINACRFPVETGDPQYVHTLRSPGRRENIGQIRWPSKTAKNSEKQRKTAKNSEKQRKTAKLATVFAWRDCRKARISAENGATLAVNFGKNSENSEQVVDELLQHRAEDAVGRAVAVGEGLDVDDHPLAHCDASFDRRRAHMREQYDIVERAQPWIDGGLVLEHI